MTPANGATGTSTSGQGTLRRPAGGPHKPVVPVIPLSYLRPPRQNPPTRTATVQSQSSPELSVGHDLSDKSARTLAEPQPGEAPETDEGRFARADQRPDTSPAALPRNQAPPSGAVTPPATTSGTVTAAIGRSASPPPSAPSSGNGTDTPTAQNPAARVQQSVASPTPTRRRAAPSFHALNNGPAPQLGGQPHPGVARESVANHERIPSINTARMHQAHPSNGSLVFGGVPSSNTSSPAPPGGGVQPPSSMSYTTEGTTAMGIDGYGRPFIVSPGFEGFLPEAFPPPAFQHAHHHHHHGPPTPHSFHGSQSSTHADENGYAAYPVINGHQPQLPQRHMATMSMDAQSGLHFPLSSGPAPVCAISPAQAQMLDFLRDGFERSDFADCTLEIRLASARQPSDGPLVIPCHRFILAQSPKLNRMLRSRDIPAGGRLVLEVHDPYMRLDSFSFAVRMLYGWDFGDGPLVPYHPHQNVKDGFDIALGYASSGAYLELPLVYAKGIHHACHQLHWDTIEKACQFAIPGTIVGKSARSGISPSSDVYSPFALVEAIKAFLVNNIPADLALDAEADDCGLSRLPRSSVTSASGRTGPMVARGTPQSRQGMQHSHHTYMPPGTRWPANPRLSSIQFGDLSLANGQQGLPDGRADTTRLRTPSHVDTILSRILLNLPFPILKQVLEHPDLGKLGKPSANLVAASRLELISTVVAAREARRVAALSNGDPQLRVFVETLERASEPLAVQELGDFLVNNMGFKEEVFPGDVPYLAQTWVRGSRSLGA